MVESEPGGRENAETKPEGRAPSRPLLEAALVFAAFWLASYLPADAAALGSAMALPASHLSLIVQLLPKTLLLLYLISIGDGFASLGIRAPQKREALGAAFVAGGALGAMLIPAALGGLLLPSLGNPLLDAVGRPQASPFILVPAILASCLAVGYAEELFFRVYLPRRLVQAGLPTLWAAICSVLLFASAHGLQGPLGLAMALLIGSWFTWRRIAGSSLHELAWGHAAYNAIVLFLTLYAGLKT